MNELFNLVGQIKEVYEMMTDPDIDEQVVNDTLEGLMGELSVHAAGIVQLRDRLDMEMEACKKQKDEWAVAEKIRKNRKARLDELVKITMTQLGVDEIEAGDVLLTLKNAGGKLPLIVDGTVPEKYTKITIENDNELIRKALDAGEELDFAHYGPRSKSIRIKK
jgi:hypothetical protein